jgi:hypothetical protein
MEKGQSKPLMELYTSALPIQRGNRASWAICGDEGMRLMRADGKVLWRIPAERPRNRLRDSEDLAELLREYEDVIRSRLRCVAFADFDGDGRKEMVIESKALELRNGRQVKRLEAFSVKGERLWRGEAQDYTHFSQYVHGDFDGDGFMEVTLEREPGIAVLDLTPH